MELIQSSTGPDAKARNGETNVVTLPWAGYRGRAGSCPRRVRPLDWIPLRQGFPLVHILHATCAQTALVTRARVGKSPWHTNCLNGTMRSKYESGIVRELRVTAGDYMTNALGWRR